jgi:hypothetical protein
VTSLSESSQGEVGENREKWGDFWEKSMPVSIIFPTRIEIIHGRDSLYNKGNIIFV